LYVKFIDGNLFSKTTEKYSGQQSTIMKINYFFLTLLLTISTVGTHSGKLDSNGGHYNKKTGQYHFHRQPSSTQTSTTQVSQANNQSIVSNVESPSFNWPTNLTVNERINLYFRRANENVGALNCNLKIYRRNVPAKTKVYIKNRDGNRCVICNSSNKLEVDHIRALQNGGNNSYANLATLCDSCHIIKTRLDNSLRRKRENICGKK